MHSARDLGFGGGLDEDSSPFLFSPNRMSRYHVQLKILKPGDEQLNNSLAAQFIGEKHGLDVAYLCLPPFFGR